jgi:predicted kinase
VYRALVRAEVTLLRLDQGDIGDDERESLLDACRTYLRLADELSRPARPTLTIMRGPSGSGKSTVARELAALSGALQISSDVERKRLHGLAPEDDSASSTNEGIYSAQATERTYRRLAEAATSVLKDERSVIVDATFTERHWRDAMRGQADALGVPFTIVECGAAPAVLAARVERRRAAASDPSEADLAVLEQQVRRWRPLDVDEQIDALSIDTEADCDYEALLKALRSRPIGS